MDRFSRQYDEPSCRRNFSFLAKSRCLARDAETKKHFVGRHLWKRTAAGCHLLPTLDNPKVWIRSLIAEAKGKQVERPDATLEVPAWAAKPVPFV